MKYLLVACIAFFSQQLSAQTFNIEPQLVDTLSADSYRYTVRGVGFFTSSCVLRVDLFDANDENSILASYAFDFSALTLADKKILTYDAEKNRFEISLGIFSSAYHRLHIWVEQDNERINEIYFN